MRATRLSIAVLGALLLLTGFLVPTATLLEALRSEAPAAPLLLRGGQLFRIGLVLDGLLALTLATRVGSIGRPTAAGAAPRRRHEAAIAIGVLAGALLLRLPRLDHGIWTDEIVTWVKYMHLSLGDILTTYDDQNNHLLFTLLARCSFRVFGESLWALRLPAVLFGVASIGALYLFAASAASRREAWLSVALVTVSYHHVWFSQNARGYTGLLFWTLLSSWLLLRLLRGGPRGLWLAYAVCAALGVFTHLSMAFIVAGHGLVWAGVFLHRLRGSQPLEWRGAVGGFALTALLVFQLHALVLPQILSGSAGPRDMVASWRNPVWTLLETARGLDVGFGTLPALAAFVLLCLGGTSFLRREPLVPAIALVPAVAAGSVMLTLGYTLYPRFFFFEIGFASLLLIGGGMAAGDLAARWLPPLSAHGTRLGTGLCVGMCLASAWSLPVAYLPKQDYEGALAFVEEGRRPGDAVVTVGVASMPFRRFYRTSWESAQTAEELDAIRARSERTWLVYSLPLHLRETQPEIWARIEGSFRTLRRFHGTLGGGVVVVCRAE